MTVLKVKSGGQWTEVAGDVSPVAPASLSFALGIISHQGSSDVVVASATYVIVRTATLLLEAGRNYALRTLSMGTYISGGAVGDIYNIVAYVDGAQQGSTIVVNTGLTGGYIPQGTYIFSFKISTSGNKVVTLQINRGTGAGQMQARFNMSILDEGIVI